MKKSKSKSLTIVLFFLITILSIVTEKAYAIPTVSIDIVNPAAIYEGDIFEARVLASGVDAFNSLLSFGFDISSDVELILDSFTVGAEFNDLSGILLGTDVAGMVKNIGTVSGDDIYLASLFFNPSATGIYGLSVGTDPFNFGLFEGLFTTAFNVYDISAQASVNVQTAPVPEPSTIMLLLGGLGLLACKLHLKRKSDCAG